MSNTETFPFTNHLINETSPYLLQHAHNPVNWFAWNDESLLKARNENKLLLISIGYSSCHWCHVMEHESFEDSAIARIMNEHFICIKVDREERPDIDQVYMNAVQLMSGRGGWPLNCIALPDGRPVYGGTYFPNSQWKNVLLNIADLYKSDPEKANEYAEKLTAGIRQSDLVTTKTGVPDFSKSLLIQTVDAWKKKFDLKEGGADYAPKFPLPNNYRFLLRYGSEMGDEDVTKQVNLSLQKMAFGGIYDQIGGGFARYSTDAFWKVPHFEKMMYDNAQLVSLFSEAYQLTKDPLSKEVVYETLEWVKREMTDESGAFYSALDADSEGEEGKFYVWTKDDLQKILQDNFSIFADYYNVNESGFWENDLFILLKKQNDDDFADSHGISVDELKNKISVMKSMLLEIRNKRIHPGLDDKSLTSWNAMMLRGYSDAYAVFNDKTFLEAALKNATFILQHQLRPDGGLNHSYKNGNSSINGFLEDYAFVIDAFISIYQSTFDEKWLNLAKQLTDYSITHFYDRKDSTGMFYFTSDLDPSLITRKMELQDNVIPSSNSQMAMNLFLLSNYFDDAEYLRISKQMLNNIKDQIPRWGSSYSNWAMLMLNYVFPFYQIAIAGSDAEAKRLEFSKYFIPNKIFIGTRSESRLPLLENKFIAGKTLVYVCEDKTCRLPVTDVSKAVAEIKKN